jgi:hypothetical protein
MVRKAFAVVGCGTVLLWAGLALAAPTAQQKCDAARVTAWHQYVSCVEKVHEQTDATSFAAHFAPFAKCRHNYFGTWPKLEQRASLLGTSCNPTNNITHPPDPRFTQNLDASNNNTTVTDNLTGLTWEKKNTVVGSPDNANNTYTWSTGTNKEDGSAFTTFLRQVNQPFPVPNVPGSLGGANGWRLPTLAELQTILLDFPCEGGAFGPSCRCPSSPCIDPALGLAGGLCWSATSLAGNPSNAWTVDTGAGVGGRLKTNIGWVRAVRGGLL